MKWQPIETCPGGERVIVYAPDNYNRQIFEAVAYSYGKFYDPVHNEWSGYGATHWMPLPSVPTDKEK